MVKLLLITYKMDTQQQNCLSNALEATKYESYDNWKLGKKKKYVVTTNSLETTKNESYDSHENIKIKIMEDNYQIND